MDGHISAPVGHLCERSGRELSPFFSCEGEITTKGGSAEAMFYIAIIILSSMSSAIGSETNIALFKDLLDLYNMNHPMIICRNLQDETLPEISSLTTQASIVNYDTNEAIYNVLNQVKVNQYWGDLDSILIVGSGHQNLNVSLVNNMKLFQFGVTGIIP